MSFVHGVSGKFAIRTLALAASVVALAPQVPAKVPAKVPSRLSAAEQRGLSFAQHHCASCHAVRPNRSSPNSKAPTFQTISRGPRTDELTLRQYLRDSHNFPAEMNFKLEDTHVEDLIEYIRTMERR